MMPLLLKNTSVGAIKNHFYIYVKTIYFDTYDFILVCLADGCRTNKVKEEEYFCEYFSNYLFLKQIIKGYKTNSL